MVQEQHGDEIWCVTTKSYATLDELKADNTGEGLTINTLEFQNGKFIFDVVADMSSSDLGSLPISILVDYALTAPGKIDQAASNADSYDGNTAIWGLTMGSSTSMHLESSSVLNVGSISTTSSFKKDGSGEMAFTYKLTQAELDKLASTGVSADTVCTELPSQGNIIPQGITFNTEQQGGDTWCVGVKPFNALTELENSITGEGLTYR